MTTKRRESAKTRRDENGNIVCSCGCGQPPGKGRRTWHSQECVDRWMWANSPEWVRTQLSKRDNGVCAKCGVDAVRAQERAHVTTPSGWQVKHGLEARMWSYRRRGGGRRWDIPHFLFGDRWAHWQPRVREAMAARREAMRQAGWDPHRRTSWWEADHIVPVAEGGGQCGPDNYRTLCCRCHRVVTNELRQRLRAAKASPVAFNCGSAADRKAVIHSGATGTSTTGQPK